MASSRRRWAVFWLASARRWAVMSRRCRTAAKEMEAKGKPGLRLALLRRGDQHGRLAAFGLRSRATEDPLGGSIERGDATAAVNGDDRVETVLDDLPHQGVLAPKLKSLGKQAHVLSVDPPAEPVEIGQEQRKLPRSDVQTQRIARLDRQRDTEEAEAAEADEQRASTPGPADEAFRQAEDQQQTHQQNWQRPDPGNHSILGDRLVGHRLHHRTRKNSVGRHGDLLAELDGRRTDDNPSAAQQRVVEASGEDIGEGDTGNVLGPDPEVEIEAALRQIAALGKKGAQGRQPGAAPGDQRRHAAQDAVRVRLNVDAGDGRVAGETGQRQAEGDVCAVFLGSDPLHERGQDHPTRRACQGLFEHGIVGRGRGGAEVDIEGHHFGARVD